MLDPKDMPSNGYVKIKSEHSKWLIREGSNLRGPYGSGIKAGTKAAIEAYAVWDRPI